MTGGSDLFVSGISSGDDEISCISTVLARDVEDDDEEEDDEDADTVLEGWVDRNESYNDFFTGFSTTRSDSSSNLRKSLNAGAYINHRNQTYFNKEYID